MKTITRLSLALSLSALAGCTVAAIAPEPAGPTQDAVLEQIRMMAAPDQNLDTIEFRAEDGCYWYWYDGPVERTRLPVRTPGGAPICQPGAVPP